jgi:3',5'-cyclic-AMP phosphodiesterase
MRRIAHISDVHVLGSQSTRSSTRYRLATKFVNWGRAPDPDARARKLARALAAVKAAGADQLVISGDLTEIGEPSEYERFAEILHDAKLPPESITLVPGNHDMYTAPDGWKKALEGPLSAFESASASTPDAVVERGDFVLLPIDSSCFQSLAFSGGQFTGAAASAIERRLDDESFRHKALVVVMHPPPAKHFTPIMQLMDGFRGCAQLLDLLARHPRLSLLHGHLHRLVDRIVARGALSRPPATEKSTTRAACRVFGAPATSDDREDQPPRFRLYEVKDGLAAPVSAAVDTERVESGDATAAKGERGVAA